MMTFCRASGVRRDAWGVYAGGAGLLLVLTLSLGGCSDGDDSTPARPRRAPGATVQQVIGKAGGTIQHPDNVVVRIPPNAFPADTTVTVQTAAHPPTAGPKVELRAPIVELSADPPQQKLFAESVTVTIPFQGKPREGLTPAYWSGSDWRPVAGRVDPATGTVSFETLSFSKYTVMVEDWSDWPEVRIEDASEANQPVREVPRGAVIRLTVRFKGTAPGVGVEGRFIIPNPSGNKDSAIELATAYDNPRVFGPRGRARMGMTDQMDSTARFLVHVPEEAALGPHGLQIMLTPKTDAVNSLGWPVIIHNAIEVVQRKVFVLDIDGLRPDIFEELMLTKDPNVVPTLKRIFGPVKDRDVAVNPQRAGTNGEKVRALRFQNGLVVKGATTIFPSYTFAGHAAIFTGAPPGLFGIPGNEWFDRRPAPGYRQRRYAFTGAFADEGIVGLLVGRTEAMDAFNAFWLPALANQVNRAGTVYDEVSGLGKGLRSIVGYNMYFGNTGDVLRLWTGICTQAQYMTTPHGLAFDRDMLRDILIALGKEDEFIMPPKEGGDLVAMDITREVARSRKANARKVGIVTLYFASLDHSGHNHWCGDTQTGPVKDVHRRMLSKYIDPLIGELWKHLDEVTRRNSLWIVVSDHGQSDVTQIVRPDLRDRVLVDAGYKVDKQVLSRKIRSNPRHGEPSEDMETAYFRDLQESDCVVAYNGGSAHVYIRLDPNYRPGGGVPNWSDFPTARQVYRAAKTIRDAALDENVWKSKIDLILLRLPKEMPALKDLGLDDLLLAADLSLPATDATSYFALDPAEGTAGRIVPLEEYLNRDAGRCVLYDPSRYRWTKADKAFLNEAIQGMNCDRSGDVVILPRYPQHHFESKDCPGNHGGLVRGDMECTLGVAVPGPATVKSDQLEKLLSESIDLNRKPRVGNRDVRSIIVNYYRSWAEFQQHLLPPGPVQIEVRRFEKGKGTRIDVTSDLIAKLDMARPDVGLQFTLYRSSTPDGKFEVFPILPLIPVLHYFPDAPKPEPGDELPGQFAKDKFMLFDIATGLTDVTLDRPKPFYYQVGITPIERRGDEAVPIGDEARSNIAGPSGKAFIRIPGAKIEDGKLNIKSSGFGWCEFSVAVSLADQDVDLHGVPLTVKAGDWTGHFWTGHTDGNTDYCDRRSKPGEAYVRVPWRPAGFPVTITAGGEASATATFTVPGDPEEAANERKAASEAVASTEQILQRDQKSVEGIRREIQELQAELAKAGAGAAAMISTQEKLARQQGAERWTIDCGLPSLRNYVRRESALGVRDFGTLVQVEMDDVTVIRKKAELTLASYDVSADMCRKRMAQASTRPDLKDAVADYEKQLTMIASNKQLAQQGYADEEATKWASVAFFAVRAGNGGAYWQAQSARIRHDLERGYKPAMADRCKEAAEDLPMLTGSREEAASLFLQARSGALESLSPEERKRRIEQQGRDLPAWWPPGRQSDLPKGAFTPDHLKVLDEGLRKAIPAPPSGTPRASAPGTN